MSTLKHRIGAKILPRMPFNRRLFDTIRYELNAAGLNIWNLVNPKHRAAVRDIRNSDTPLSVNLGSGGRGLPGWVNIEMRRASDSTLVIDMRRPLPIPSESTDRILAEHVLEHFDFRTDALHLAKEAYRILRPNGVLRVIVPDCERYINAYTMKDADLWQQLGWNLDQLPHDIYTPMHIINHQFHQEGEHFFGYDFDTLKFLLTRAGFSEITRQSYRQSIDPHLEFDQENHRKYSLYVDARK